jgi:hypothetical protein
MTSAERNRELLAAIQSAFWLRRSHFLFVCEEQRGLRDLSVVMK